MNLTLAFTICPKILIFEDLKVHITSPHCPMTVEFMSVVDCFDLFQHVGFNMNTYGHTLCTHCTSDLDTTHQSGPFLCVSDYISIKFTLGVPPFLRYYGYCDVFYYLKEILKRNIYLFRAMKAVGRQHEHLYKKTGLTVHLLAYEVHIKQYRDALNIIRSVYLSSTIFEGSNIPHTLFKLSVSSFSPHPPLCLFQLLHLFEHVLPCFQNKITPIYEKFTKSITVS